MINTNNKTREYSFDNHRFIIIILNLVLFPNDQYIFLLWCMSFWFISY